MMAAAMGSFGERMQREREMRGITLEEISESTKITSRCLQALEEEEFDKLPGGIFNKGFVRAYAHYLGIDEDQAVADFVVASGGEKEQPLPDPPEPRAVTLGQRAEGHPNWRAIALLVVLLVTVVAVLWKLGPSAVRLVAAAWTARSNPEAAATSPAPAIVTPQSTPEVVATPPPPPPAATKKSVAKAKSVAVAASSPATAPPAPPAPAAAPSPPPQARSSDFVVQIRATEDAWVQIVADGKLFSEGVMVPPAEKRVRAAKQVVIKTGNGAGVEVSFNGQPLPPLGEENQMATVTLTAAGVQR
ncbi:MAG TPA: helix-turn-helix domain-containing protein [Terriglobales bacterium]|nr:helix-turn-helix domain-containing protein [Terriglobales bacterium]